MDDLFNIKRFSDSIDNDTEFIPLLSSEEEELMQAEKLPESLPILPLRNTVLFPGVVIPITVGRDKSIRLIRESYRNDRTIGVVAQKDSTIEDPEEKDLYKVGTLAQLIKILQMPDGNTTVIIQGKKRFEIEDFMQDEPYFRAKIKDLADFDKILERDEHFLALICFFERPGHPDHQTFPEYSVRSGIRHKKHRQPLLSCQFCVFKPEH